MILGIKENECLCVDCILKNDGFVTTDSMKARSREEKISIAVDAALCLLRRLRECEGGEHAAASLLGQKLHAHSKTYLDRIIDLIDLIHNHRSNHDMYMRSKSGDTVLILICDILHNERSARVDGHPF